MKEYKTKDLLPGLIKGAELLGLKDEDLNSAREFLNYHEFGLSFDTIVTQMYEQDLEIDEGFYKLIKTIAEQMNLNEEDYTYMQELVRGDDIIPKRVKDELAKIIDSLNQA